MRRQGRLSLTQAEALQNAIDMLIDLENDQSKDAGGDWSKQDAALLKAAREIQTMLQGK